MPRTVTYERRAELLFADAAAKERFMSKLDDAKHLLKKRLHVRKASDITHAEALERALDNLLTGRQHLSDDEIQAVLDAID